MAIIVYTHMIWYYIQSKNKQLDKVLRNKQRDQMLKTPKIN